MRSRIRVITPPTNPVISTDLLRQHARITNQADDNLLTSYIAVATALVEQYISRALLTQTLEWTLVKTTPPNSMPVISVPFMVVPLGLEYLYQFQNHTTIELPRSPAQSVVSVATGKWGEEDTTLTESGYELDLQSEPSRIKVLAKMDWDSNNHLVVTYVTGYGDTPDTVPVGILHATLMVATHLYENRGDVESPEIFTSTVQALLGPHRIFEFG